MQIKKQLEPLPKVQLVHVRTIVILEILKIVIHCLQDVLEFIEGAENGVMYLALGLSFNDEYVPEEDMAALMRALGRLPQRVVARFNVSNRMNEGNLIRTHLISLCARPHPRIAPAMCWRGRCFRSRRFSHIQRLPCSSRTLACTAPWRPFGTECPWLECRSSVTR